MSGAVASTPVLTDRMVESRGQSLGYEAWRRLRAQPWAMGALAVLVLYAVVALLTQFGWIAEPWDRVVGGAYEPPSFRGVELWLGTDLFGRSVLYKTLHGTRIAMSVGLVSCLIAIPVGVCLGAVAGYFGGWVDEVIVWLYSTLASIPNILLLLAIAYLAGRGMTAVYVALSATAWIGMARVIRGEVLKHKDREYVLAAKALGVGHWGRITRHILPNVVPFVIVQFSMQFMAAIKAEVILSFLGLGARNLPSWGLMIDDAKLELGREVWWGLAGATVGMFGIVLALNILGDALRDALDPKTR